MAHNDNKLVQYDRTDGWLVHTSSSHPCSSVRVVRVVVGQPMPAGLVDRAGSDDYFLAAFPGPVTLRDSSGTRTWDGGAVVCWTPDTGHVYGSPDREWMHSCTHIDGPDAASLMGGMPLNRVVPCGDTAFVDRFLAVLYHEVRRPGAPDEVILRNTVESLVRTVASRSDTFAQGTDVPASYLQVRDLLTHDFAQKLTVGELAQALHISTSKFASDYRCYFGTSPIADRLESQMTQARYLLRNRNLTISEVAYRVGIDNLPYFSRMVRKRFGKSPRELRRGEG